MPSSSEFNRFAIFWRMGDGVLEGVRVDPAWDSDGSSVNMISEFGRQLLVEYFRTEPPTDVEMADGTVYEADVPLYGTGYEASKFLTPMSVTGRDGRDLYEQWAGDARAYLGSRSLASELPLLVTGRTRPS